MILNDEVKQQFEEVKQEASLTEYASRHLQRAKAGYKYGCPKCKSGIKGTPNSDSGFQIKETENKFLCRSCGFHGDIYDLVAQVEHIDVDNKRAQLEAVGREFNIPVDLSVFDKKNSSQNTATRQQQDQGANNAAVISANTEEAKEKERAYLRWVFDCFTSGVFSEEIEEYLLKRNHPELLKGIEIYDDEGYLHEYHIGYDPDKKRLVFPFVGSDYYHIDRTISNTNPKYLKPSSKSATLTQPLFNPEALKQPTVFVCEGIFDWLSLVSCGITNAIPLFGTAYKRLLQAIQNQEHKPIALFLLDNDEAGINATDRAIKDWQEAKLPCYMVDRSIFPDGVKDIDELVSSVRTLATVEQFEALCARLSAENEKAIEVCAQTQEEAYKRALEAHNVYSLQDTLTNVYTLANAVDPISTGFISLDNALGGGLNPGLVSLGAISSLGKTTLVLQIADHIAKSKRPVLFVSIEQGIDELNAKSLSRYTKLLPGGDKYASTANEITNKQKRNSWSIDKHEQLLKACNQYSIEAGEYMHILQANNQPSVEDIREIAEEITRHDGIAPVVFIDYLQLLAPQSERDSDKQAIDKNVMALRQLSRDLKTPVVVISSLNRASYSGSVSLDSFKESGAIEYGSDVLIGLQPANLDEKTSDISDEAKKKTASKKIIRYHKNKPVRECSLLILKNRNGAINENGIKLTFDALHSLYYETTEGNKHKSAQSYMNAQYL